MKQLILIVFVMTTLQVKAQQKRKGHHEKAELMKALTPEEMADIKTKRMTLDLDLNDNQQKEVQVILLENAKMKQQKMEARQKAKEENKDKSKSKEAFLEHTHEKLDHQIEMKAKMKSILSPEQYEKWEKIMARKNKGSKRKHKRKSDN